MRNNKTNYQLSSNFHTLTHWQNANDKNKLVLNYGAYRYFFLGWKFDPLAIAYSVPSLADYASDPRFFNVEYIGYNNSFQSMQYKLTTTKLVNDVYYKAVCSIFPAVHSFSDFPLSDTADSLAIYTLGLNSGQTNLVKISASTTTTQTIAGTVYSYKNLEDLLNDNPTATDSSGFVLNQFIGVNYTLPNPLTGWVFHVAKSAGGYYSFTQVYSGGYHGNVIITIYSDYLFMRGPLIFKNATSKKFPEDVTNVVTTTDFTYRNGRLISNLEVAGYTSIDFTTAKKFNFSEAFIFDDYKGGEDD